MECQTPYSLESQVSAFESPGVQTFSHQYGLKNMTIKEKGED